MMLPLLAAAICALQIHENLTIYPLIPPEAGLGWKLELFDLAEPIVSHYHKIQRQIMLVVEGEMQVCCAGKEPVVLQSGNLVCVEPGIVHSLVPETKKMVRFFTIDLPGFLFPEDVFYDVPIAVLQWAPSNTEFLPLPDSKYVGARIDQGDYAVYELASGTGTGGKWSAAILEIKNSPRHFHRIGKEIFVVVNGKLAIEIDGVHKILAAGELVEIAPGVIHQLRSENEEPVRVLCFNFPAFDPADMYVD